MKKKHAEEHFNAEAWLLPYADMITLMLAFFIILYALSIDDSKDMKSFARSVKMALGLPELVQPGGKVPPNEFKSDDGKYKPQKKGASANIRTPFNDPSLLNKKFNIKGSDGITEQELGELMGLKKEKSDNSETSSSKSDAEKFISEVLNSKGKASADDTKSGGKTEVKDTKAGGKTIDEDSKSGGKDVLNAGKGKEGEKVAGQSEKGIQIGGETSKDNKFVKGMTDTGKKGASGEDSSEEKGSHGLAGLKCGGYTHSPEDKSGGKSVMGDSGAIGKSVGGERGGADQFSGEGSSDRGNKGAQGLSLGIESGGQSLSGDLGAKGKTSGEESGGIATKGDRGAKSNIGEKISGASDFGTKTGGKTNDPNSAIGGKDGTKLQIDKDGKQTNLGSGKDDTIGEKYVNQDGKNSGNIGDKGIKIGGSTDQGIKSGGETKDIDQGKSGVTGKLDGGKNKIKDQQIGGIDSKDMHSGNKSQNQNNSNQGMSQKGDLKSGISNMDTEMINGIELPVNPKKKTMALLWALKNLHSEKIRNGQIDFSVTKRGLELHFKKNLLFEMGTAKLKPESKKLLNHVSKILQLLPDSNNIRVEGHTDTWPVSSFLYPSNWELSTSRATSVVRYLVEYEGLNAGRFAAAGFGEYKPVDTNQTPEGRANNRRIDIVILNADNMAELPEFKETLINRE